MGSKVIFKNKMQSELVTEFVPFSEDLLKNAPETFKNDRDKCAELSLIPTFCLFFDDNQPYYYYRHSNPDSTRFVGISKLGDGPLDYQKGGYTYEMAAPIRNDKTTVFSKIDDEHVMYGFESFDGKMVQKFGTNTAYIKEGDLLELEYNYFPYAVIDHSNVWPNAAVVYQSAHFNGIFNGKPIYGIGRCDKSYTVKSEDMSAYSFDFNKVNFNNEFSGVREDGRREDAVIDIMADGGVWAYYWLEGEEPVTSDTVEMETDFYRVPYLNDGTCMYKDVVFRFAGKEIHMNGKWGTKGYTGYPNFSKKGQCEIVGPWYEGSKPYNHSEYFSFNEVQDCYDDELEKLGFKVFK